MTHFTLRNKVEKNTTNTIAYAKIEKTNKQIKNSQQSHFRHLV